jgi:hypothetical protein
MSEETGGTEPAPTTGLASLETIIGSQIDAALNEGRESEAEVAEESVEPEETETVEYEQAVEEDAGEDVLSQTEEEAEDTAPETDEGEQPEWFQKRIDKLTRKRREAEEALEERDDRIAELEKQLQEQPTAPKGENEFANVLSDKELSEAEQLTDARREYAMALEDALDDDDEKLVGELLKKEGYDYDDMSEREVRNIVKMLQRNVSNASRKWLPAARQRIGYAKQADKVAVERYPWLKNEDSKENQLLDEVLVNAPWFKMLPDYKLQAARYVRGYMAELASMQKKPAAKVPSQPSKPVAKPAPVDKKSASIQSARERVLTKRDQKSLQGLIGSMLG